MGVNDDLGLRLPEVEWSYRSNAGELRGLGWVDARLDPDLPPARAVGVNGTTQFRHFPHLAVMPPFLAEDALAAQRRGRPTAWEGLALVFSRAGWTVSARGLLWAPYSPYPGVLSQMVEAFGVERGMHHFDPGNLSRLAAMLPSWYPGRGRLASAQEVLRACGVSDRADKTWGQDDAAPEGALREEVLCCHTAEWWRARTPSDGAPSYRITGGLLRFQPQEGAPFDLRREDFLVLLPKQGGLSLALHRLLPAWASIRITTSAGDEVTPKAKPQGEQARPAEPADKKKGAAKKADAPKAKPDASKPKKSAKASEDDVQDALVPMDEGEDELLVMDDEGDLVDLEIEAFDLLEADEDGDPPTDPSAETSPAVPSRARSPKNDKPGGK